MNVVDICYKGSNNQCWNEEIALSIVFTSFLRCLVFYERETRGSLYSFRIKSPETFTFEFGKYFKLYVLLDNVCVFFFLFKSMIFKSQTRSFH